MEVSFRSSDILDWIMLDRVHKKMKTEIADGPMGFHTARTPDGKPYQKVADLAKFYLDHGDAEGLIDMEANVELSKKVYPDLDEATIRMILEAYNQQVAPELELKKCHLRRAIIVYLYFAPFDSLEEKMAFMFTLADANGDDKLTREELKEALTRFLKTAESFMPQIEKVASKTEAELYIKNLKLVYDDNRIDMMVENCFEACGVKGTDGTISNAAWKAWISPENLKDAFGRASSFLTAL